MLKTTVSLLALHAAVAYSAPVMAQSSETTTTTTAQPVYPTETSKTVERHSVTSDGTQVDATKSYQSGSSSEESSSQVKVTNPDGSTRMTTQYQQSGVPAPTTSTTTRSTTTTESP
jgi:hypothetical protein